MFDVISLGTATLDVFLRSPGLEVDEKSGEKDICVRYGAKIEVNEIFFETGGGGTNTAVTFSRQGLKAACIVQIGGDFAGEKIIADLMNEGVETELLDIQKENFTDYSTILWAGDGGRTILVYRGKTRLEKTGVFWDKLQTNWFYISSLEGNLEIVKEIISKFPDSRIAWNPGGRELSQKEELLPMLNNVTVLNINKEEMEQLLGKTGEIGELLVEAQKLPCLYIVITDDQRGAYLWSKEEKAWFHSGIFEDSPRVETTGAGDSFASTFTSAIALGKKIPEALSWGPVNSMSVVQQIGAQKGLLFRDKLEMHLKNAPKSFTPQKI